MSLSLTCGSTVSARKSRVFPGIPKCSLAIKILPFIVFFVTPKSHSFRKKIGLLRFLLNKLYNLAFFKMFHVHWSLKYCPKYSYSGIELLTAMIKGINVKRICEGCLELLN